MRSHNIAMSQSHHKTVSRENLTHKKTSGTVRNLGKTNPRWWPWKHKQVYGISAISLPICTIQGSLAPKITLLLKFKMAAAAYGHLEFRFLSTYRYVNEDIIFSSNLVHTRVTVSTFSKIQDGGDRHLI